MTVRGGVPHESVHRPALARADVLVLIVVIAAAAAIIALGVLGL
jgi:hypothetical protein